MSYSVSPGNIFGRIGTNLGQGLAEQIPKEVEHQRLRTGLQNLAAKSGNLTPEQFLAEAYGTYGITPQMAQSFGELARQRARGNALSKQAQKEKPSSFPISPKQESSGKPSETPSITTPQDLERIIQGFIPPSRQDIENKASELYNANPAFYDYNADKALQASQDYFQRQKDQYEAYKEKHQTLTGIQDSVSKKLLDQAVNLGVEIPPDTFSKVEDKAIKSVIPKALKGEGKSEQQAMKDYGAELDEISRQYKDIESLSTINPFELKRRLESLQNEFRKRGDTRNLALKLASQLKVSPMMAYKFADPVKNIPKLKQEVDQIKITGSPEYVKNTQNSTFEKLRKAMGTQGSPLSVAYELDKKNYSAKDWLAYLENYKDELTGYQIDQLNKGIPNFYTLSELWLKAFGE